ncbi:MAG: hypothetical protein V7K88_12350 [Nostoc sp.]
MDSLLLLVDRASFTSIWRNAKEAVTLCQVSLPSSEFSIEIGTLPFFRWLGFETMLSQPQPPKMFQH